MKTLLRYHMIHLVSGCFLIVFVFMWAGTNATCFGLQCQAPQGQLETVPPVLLPMNLTLIGLNGTQVVLNSTDIASLPSARGLGGFGSLNNYTGVPLTALCNIVGGISNSSVVKVTASDNYNQTLSFDQVVNGNFTGLAKPLTPIIAYYGNDINLTSDEGPLMLAFIGPEGILTSSRLWVWHVIKIEVLSGAVPEFQSFTVTLFLLMTAVTAMILLKRRRSGIFRSSAR